MINIDMDKNIFEIEGDGKTVLAEIAFAIKAISEDAGLDIVDLYTRLCAATISADVEEDEDKIKSKFKLYTNDEEE